jgi:hypothetical protein
LSAACASGHASGLDSADLDIYGQRVVEDIFKPSLYPLGGLDLAGPDVF